MTTPPYGKWRELKILMKAQRGEEKAGLKLNDQKTRSRHHPTTTSDGETVETVPRFYFFTLNHQKDKDCSVKLKDAILGRGKEDQPDTPCQRDYYPICSSVKAAWFFRYPRCESGSVKRLSTKTSDALKTVCRRRLLRVESLTAGRSNQSILMTLALGFL